MKDTFSGVRVGRGRSFLERGTLVVALAVVSCAGDDPITVKKGAGGSSGKHAGQAGAPDQTSGAGRAGEAGAPSQEGVRGYGEITAFTFGASGAVGADLIGAAFYAKPQDRNPGRTVTTETLGPCVLTTLSSAGGTPSDPPPSLSAGTITMTGGNYPVPMTLMGNNYAPSSGAPLTPGLYTAGQTLSFTATGGTVPPFAVSLPAPASVKLRAPLSKVTEVSLHLPAAGGLALGFEAAGGTVRVSLDRTSVDDTNSTRLDCLFDAKSGSVMIPGATLAKLPKGESWFTVYAIETATVAAGTFDVDVTLLGHVGPAEEGKLAPQLVVLE